MVDLVAFAVTRIPRRWSVVFLPYAECLECHERLAAGNCASVIGNPRLAAGNSSLTQWNAIH